jgi:hypothetical protein
MAEIFYFGCEFLSVAVDVLSSIKCELESNSIGSSEPPVANGRQIPSTPLERNFACFLTFTCIAEILANLSFETYPCKLLVTRDSPRRVCEPFTS